MADRAQWNKFFPSVLCQGIYGAIGLMYKTVTWNTGPAAERARFNLKLKKKKAKSYKPQAPSCKRLKKDTIMN
jgi:hypothetical protein